MQLVFIVLLYQPLEYHHHHKASVHHIISKLIHHLITAPPLHKQFDPWDVKCNSHCYSKMFFSDLALSCIANQHFFLQHDVAVYIPASSCKMC